MKRRPKYTSFIPDDVYSYLFERCRFKIFQHRTYAAGGFIQTVQEVKARSDEFFVTISKRGENAVRLFVEWQPSEGLVGDSLQFPGLHDLEDLKKLSEFTGGF